MLSYKFQPLWQKGFEIFNASICQHCSKIIVTQHKRNRVLRSINFNKVQDK